MGSATYRNVTYVALGLLGVGMAVWPASVFTHNPITTTVRFDREVSAVLNSKCVQCHSPGKSAMSLTTYEEVRPWAVAIKEEILARRMPPWAAEHGYGDFRNDLALTLREIEFLVSWVDGGTPEGDGAPAAFIDHSGHWMLGRPDAVLNIDRSVRVEANSPLHVRRIVVDPGFNKERWLRAIDYQPGDPRVTHAAFLTIVGTGEYVGAWTPWQSSSELPEDVGLRLPARARIAVDVWYRGTNETVADQPRMALYFHTKQPARAATALELRTQGSPVSVTGIGLRSRAEQNLRQDTTLLGLYPQLRSGAKSFEVSAHRPDGSTEVLLWIRNASQNWPTPYLYREPLQLPLGTRIRATAYYGDSGPPRQSGFTVTLTTSDGARTPPPTGAPSHHHH